MTISITVKHIGIAYVLLLLTFLTSIIGIYHIPQAKIVAQVRETSDILSQEGAYYDTNGSIYYLRDNFTDALMVNIAMTADDQHPMTSAMNACYMGTGNLDMSVCLYKVANGETSGLPATKYARYWHGNQIFLRPLLTMFNIKEIRLLNYFCFAILFLLLSFLLYKRTDIGICLIFMLSVYGFIVPFVPSSMQFSACFYVGLLSCLTILLWPSIVRDEVTLATTLFCIGGITVFVDLLTTPLVTLGLPLIVANMIYMDKDLKRSIIGCASWFMGYGLLWISKWVMGYLLTGFNIISDAMEAARFRMSNSVVIDTYSSMPATEYRIVISCVVAVIWLALILLFRKRRRHGEYDWLLALAMLFPTWRMVLYNHTYLHHWFTWRSYSVTLLALLLYVYLSIRDYARKKNSSSDTLL